ncbi:MAG: hypothetical protein A2945_03530 [Candidatus Liptonbacteria bacterium RIFCSPLOWO2_01_FULL_52_25]|uniref:starch synthase n=1 Tax=Candidatus Liptonbacteria bacterium RIFCSPLOWO2_01_FULL_52_25 TaxID=1798650 RepID=A0A1G2CIA7_9BACT|nr:MAG: hypothetical protein A2945_03530 [Candidatus Liptonbacteria bacterium RIFCSPLOWO2_01_FULL_52_25]
MKPCTVAFIVAEMMIPELGKFACNGNFRGGLGDLSGHIPDGMAGRGVKVLPITYFYPTHWQTREPINYHHTPAQWLFDLDVDIHFGRRTVPIFGIGRAGAWAYGINDPCAGYLYPGNSEKKIDQAAFLGRAVPALLKRLGQKPDIMWCQEWMAGLVIPNMRDDPYFDDTKYLFTIHTTVREALETFPAEWYGKTAVDGRHCEDYIRNGNGRIDISFGSVKQAHRITGVSEENGEVLRAMFPEAARENKISGIMNGVSRNFMLSPHIKALGDNPTPEGLWGAHLQDKQELLQYIQAKTGMAFNPQKPLVGLVRRLATYKNQKPMFEKIVEAICSDRDETANGREGLATNLFIGGIAHEDDGECRQWMSEFAEWMKNPHLRGRFVYIPEYSERIRTLAVRGSDTWVSCPQLRLEACGTSDFGAKMNGNPNIASRTGGIREHGKEINFETGEGDTLFIEPYNSATLYLQLKRMTGRMYDFLENGNGSWLTIRANNFLGGKELDVAHMIEKYEKLCFEPLLEQDPA